MTWQKKSPLFVDEILEWADAHYERTDDWPIGNHAERVYEAPDENWRALDLALRRGYRTLPPGQSLAQLLEEYRGRRNRKNLPEYRLHDILAWADAHFKRTGGWPLLTSGAIADAPGETWQAVQDALWNGQRGLPGGYSLARLLADHRGVRNHLYMPPLSIEQILDWADAFRNRHGRWPTIRSGGIEGEPWETWWNCDYCLSHGARGLPGGSSLARLLGERRGVRNQSNVPPLDEGQILQWADAHRERVGRWPNENQGPVFEAPEETWAAVDIALRVGSRGLPGGGSLPRLLNRERGVRNQQSLPHFQVEQILDWADAHFSRCGEWPRSTSGTITEAPDEKWSLVDNALISGLPGLPGGSSLPQLLAQRRGVRNIHALPRLSISIVLNWADDHFARIGRWPRSDSGSIPGTGSTPNAAGDTWDSVDQCLRSGRRGFPGDSSLARLLAEHRGVRNRKGLPPLNEDDIVRWILAFWERSGKWPTVKSGPVEDAPGETWAAVSSALRNGIRGMPGGTTLARLIRDRCVAEAGG